MRDRLSLPSHSRFAAIIFDMGGTLLEFENVPWDALYPSSLHSLHDWLARSRKRLPSYGDFHDRFAVLLERRRARIRSEMREYRITPLVRELLDSFQLVLPRGEISKAVNAYYAAIRRQVSAFPDARPALEVLRHDGYKIGLLSNTPFRASDHREELLRFGLWPYFDATLFTSTVTYRKPHPSVFREIARRLHVSPKRCLYIGDRQKEDVQGPQGVGMTACLIRRPGNKYVEGMTKSLEISSLAELMRNLI